MIELKNYSPKILVIGDLMIDHYLWGSCERISPEAPVQVVDIINESTSLGGAGNVINNLNALGAKVDVISVVGHCTVTKDLKLLLEDININTDFLISEEDRITSKKTRIIASHQQVARYDRECNDEISDKSIASIKKKYKEIINDYDAILLSDYGKGVLTFELTQSLIKIANKNRIKILVDPKGLNYSKYRGAYLLTPNKMEAFEATKIDIKDAETLASSISLLKNQCNLDVSLITLSDQGVAIYDDSLRIHPTVAKEVFDVTGAGDTILASLGFALSCNMNIDDAVKFANLAAGIVVGKLGSATASLNEIIEYESSLEKSNKYSRIKSWNEISLIIAELKKNNKKIIFTNGCFDILHIGHIKYLEKAKSFGDILIVGLNSDQSVKRLKGNDRPVTLQYDRAYILASLDVVDYLVIFNEDTPLDLIKLIKPDVLVKGGDYKDKEVVGQDLVDDIQIVKFIEEKSTTKIINKIKKYE
tara:strand:+ start:15372 stop:16799 length:1428 start_codon:yes stop_codon:yes gene_type:complete